MRGFETLYRNPGHWDLVRHDGRAFRIRGEPGNVVVHDERKDGRPFPRAALDFNSVIAAMTYCADQLMSEEQTYGI